MEKFKEFQGKDLDGAIECACAFFNCAREKMEIEILQDAKSGIFGIVGARKAKIRARRIHLEDAVQNLLGAPAADKKKEKQKNTEKKAASQDAEKLASSRESRPGKSASQIQRPAGICAVSEDECLSVPMPAMGANLISPAAKNKPKANANTRRTSTVHRGVTEGHSHSRSEPRHENAVEMDFMANEVSDDLDEGYAVRPLEELDRERVEKVVAEVVSRLIEPIAGRNVPVTVDMEHGRILARVEWEGDAGLLIGREGLTLVAIQYLASRMVSRAMNAALRVQLDIGDYHKRQDDKLRETARILAEKARKTGKSWSTRPLSSYHRRIIHLILQNEPDVQTRSSGEGTLKRVIISPKRHGDRQGG